MLNPEVGFLKYTIAGCRKQMPILLNTCHMGGHHACACGDCAWHADSRACVYHPSGHMPHGRTPCVCMPRLCMACRACAHHVWCLSSTNAPRIPAGCPWSERRMKTCAGACSGAHAPKKVTSPRQASHARQTMQGKRSRGLAWRCVAGTRSSLLELLRPQGQRRHGPR